MKKTLCLLWIPLLAMQMTPGVPAAASQGTSDNQQQVQATASTLTNKDVLDMHKMGQAPEIIVATIRKSVCNFDTSPTALQELKTAGVPDAVISAMTQAPVGAPKPAAPLATPSTSAQPQTLTPPATAVGNAPSKLLLEDGTPVKLRIGQTVSSADAHVGDRVDFEVLEEIRAGGMLVIPKGGIAWATVTEAQPKRRMARGGKLGMNIDAVRLITGEKAALRAVKEVKGGGHTGAMTGGIVATGLVFFPAAPFFLFMHGKDITVPKGTEVTAFINGNFPLDPVKLHEAASPTQPSTPVVVSTAVTPTQVNADAELEISSVPLGAEVQLDGNFVGNTPSTIGVSLGDHLIAVKRTGYKAWERKIKISSGKVKIVAELEAETTKPESK